MHLISQGNAGATSAPTWTLSLGDCRELLADVPSASVDAVICDPPYPEVDRDYGRFTVDEWFDLMRDVVAQARRVLKPKGSAVFVLQPNMERIGKMRPWLWDFLAWACREWNVIQDVYWWNHTTPPVACANLGMLLRPSMKNCVWLGPPDCDRYQDAVLWTESDSAKAQRLSNRCGRVKTPSGFTYDPQKINAAFERRGGVTPFNVLPIPTGNPRGPAGILKHPAATPPVLCRWWIDYLTKPGDTVLDPFAGGATVGEEAIRSGRHFIGFERIPKYYGLSSDRLTAAYETTWDRAA